MPTEGVDEAFGPLWASALDADVRGQSKACLKESRLAVEMASKSPAGPGREQALRMAHHLTGVSLLRLGRVSEAVRALDKAREVAVRSSSAGMGCDAYTDVGGVLVDMGVALALQGDLDGGQKHLSRSLYMAERAYRPDDDLLATACINLSELLSWRGTDDEQALELAERAVRLTDKMERLSLIQKQEEEEDKDGSQAQQRVGGGGSGGGGGVGVAAAAAKAKKGRTPGDAGDPIWAVPPELLALYARGIARRLNLGRLVVRSGGRPQEEGLLYVFQALQDSRKAGLRGNVILYSQCLAAAGAAHLTSMLAKGAAIDTSHLVGCTEENEVTWGAEALLQKALGVLSPVLGDRHPETAACHANLALLLPLQSGVAALQEAAMPAQKDGERKESSSGSSGSSLDAGVRDNHKALAAVLKGLAPQEAQSKCAAELAVGRVLWAFNGVLGVGLRSWPAAAGGPGSGSGSAE